MAKDGLDALAKIESLDPDLLTLDVQMPDMDGIEVLRRIKQLRLRPKAIMVSSLTSQGAQVTTDALMEGAFDFILKPSSNDSSANRLALRDELTEKITAFRESSLGRSDRRRRPAGNPARNIATGKVVEHSPAPATACRLVLLGASTGGPEALKFVLPRIPGTLSAPLLIVQHMPPKYTRSLAGRLNEISELHVLEGEDQMEASAGRAIIAPGGCQMALERSGTSLLVRISDAPAENGVRPSVDFLLRSAVEILQGQALAVIMTGMGRDGLAGCRLLKQAGGYVFAQHQDDCVVYGMPKAVVDNDLADRILPLGKIAPALVRHVKRSNRS
jgi:two-component system chemotaxis response regulator CheB